MYQFFIKNYMKNGSFQSQESLVYSVPIQDETMSFSDPSIKSEMGKAGSFEFSVHPTHPLYDCWRQMRTIIRIEYDGDTIFRGRVITVDNTPLTGERKIHAEGDLAFFLDSQQEGVKDDDRPEVSVYTYLQQIIGEHNSQMGNDNDKKILLGMVPGRSGYSELPMDQQVVVDEDGRKYGSSSWQNTMSALEQLQKTFGGVFRTRYQNGTVYLDWLENYFSNSVNTQVIEVSENVVTVSNSSEVENIFTYLIPVGSLEGEDLYLPEMKLAVADIIGGYSDEVLNSGYHMKQDYLDALDTYGPIVKVEQFRNADTEEKLRRYAYDFIRHNFLGGVHSFTITAIDMHHLDGGIQKILIGDRVSIRYPTGQMLPNGQSAMAVSTFTATSINYHPHDPEQNEYVIGIPESQMSKEYGITKSKKSSISSASGSNANAFSSGISSAFDQFNTPEEFPELVQEVKSYDDLAWTVVQNMVPEPGCWYDQSRYNQALSSYPTANSKFQVELICHDLIKNHMATGEFGSVSIGPLTVSASNRAGSTNAWANPRASSGVTVTPEINGILPGIKEMVEIVLGGYLAYIKNHPDFLSQEVPSAILEVLGGNGLTIFSSSLGDLRLPEGWDISGQGSFDISGLLSGGGSGVLTSVLNSLGITVPANGILSKENMKKLLNNVKGLSPFLDSVTGVFDPQKLLNKLPESIRKGITNGELTKKASDWLLTKFPILKSILGQGQTQLTMQNLSDFIGNVPLLAPDKIATVSSNSGTVSSASVGTGSGISVDQNGIQIRPILIHFLDENGVVTYESITQLMPKLKTGFVMENGAVANPPMLTRNGTNYLIKRFPELGGLVDATGRIRLNSINAYIQSKIASGELKNTSNSTAVIDANTGEVKASEVALGKDAEATPTVTVGQTGITLRSAMYSLLDNNTGTVTYDSLTHVMPKLVKGWVYSGGVRTDTLSESGANYLVQRFPELSVLRDSNGRFTLNALTAYILNKKESGDKESASSASVTIDANSGEVKATELALGSDAEANPTVKADGEDGSVKLGNGTTDKVSLNGWDGIQHLGKDANGNWLIQMNEPIEYTDSSGVSHTVPAGTIGAKDFHLDEIPSFKTKFAVIDQLVAGKATIGQLNAAEARITTLETDTVKANELYVQDGAYVGYLKADTGIISNGPIRASNWIYCGSLSASTGINTTGAVSLSDDDGNNYTDFRIATVKFGDSSSYKIMSPQSFKIGLKADENDNGTISISFVDDPQGTQKTANFKIAATKKYKDDVAASYISGWDAARAKVVAPEESTSSDTITVGIPASTVNQASSYDFTVSVDNNYAYIKKYGLNTVVARVENPAYTNGWDAARAKVVAPSQNTSSNTMTVGIPGSTVNQASSYDFTVSVDNDYAYIKKYGLNTVVARVENPAYANGRNSVTVSAANIIRTKSDVYNSNTHNTFIYVKAAASNGNESGEKYFQVSGDNAYNDGYDNAIDSISFQKSELRDNSYVGWTDVQNSDSIWVDSAHPIYTVLLEYFNRATNSWVQKFIDLGHKFLLAANRPRQWKYYDDSSQTWYNLSLNGEHYVSLYYVNPS